MKKVMRYSSAALCLAAVMLFGSTCFAQVSYPFLAAGSTGAFNAFSIAGVSGTTPLCTNVPNNSTLSMATNVFVWTEKSSAHTFQALDGRSGTLDAQNAKGWIEWQTADGTAGGTVTAVCVYLAVDSIVGQRLFFATTAAGTPAGSINFPGGCTSGFPIAGGNQIPAGILPPDTPLPATVCTALQGQIFNAAPTDITAEDAQFGTQRVCGAYIAAGTTLGYNCNLPTPTEIHSGVGGSTGEVQTVNYAIEGTDPLTGGTLAHTAAGVDGHPWVSLNAGGQVMLVIVNTNDTSTSGFGTAALTNVNRPDLGRVFTGSSTRTRDLIPVAGLASKPLTALVREPLSGTMNTFEFQVTRTQEYNHSQEDLTNNGGGYFADGIGMSTPTGWTWEGSSVTGSVLGDPLDWFKTSTGGLKVRVIGTGEMVSTLAGNSLTDAGGKALTNQIGYTFFSFGNVAPLVGLAKYLTVDGVDPLFNSYSGGALPTCTAPCPNAVTLTNVANGSYPIWNFVRVITSGTLGGPIETNGVVTGCVAGATVCELVLASEAAYAQIPDLVSINNMRAFRSHQTKDDGVNFVAHNGYKHYGTGITGTPCGFAPVTGASVQYECGGDVAGARFQIQTELDTNTDSATELTGFLQ